MNERIKQLAEQAKIEFTYDPTETPMRAFAECWEDELVKFAELIVRECADVAKETRWAVPPSQEQIARGIQQHFGVEE